jgi:plasmid stabilization system protein ParE
MAYHVEITLHAEQDAEAILDWLLLQQSGKAGIEWFLAVDEAFASLVKFPERCSIAPESSQFPFDVRQLLYGRKPNVYRILFTIDEDKVVVLHLRHGRRKAVTPTE